MVIDQNGIPHIAYFDDFNDKLKYGTKVDDKWVTKVVYWSNVDGLYPSIALGPKDQLRVTHYMLDIRVLMFNRLYGNFFQQTAFIRNLNVGATSLVMDQNDNPHIIYYDLEKKTIEYAHLVRDILVSQTVAAASPDGVTFPIVLEENKNPFTCYYANGQGLKCARLKNETWEIQTVESGNGTGIHPSLAVDNQGRPHISYYDQNLKSLKHAFLDGSTWKIEIVDNSGDVGNPSSIAIDKQNRIHICYYDLAAQSLKYALWNGKSWQITLVDNYGNVGLVNSLALDKKGNPHIVYYDRSNFQLKYAIAVSIGKADY